VEELLKRNLGNPKIIQWSIRQDEKGNWRLLDEKNKPHGRGALEQCDSTQTPIPSVSRSPDSAFANLDVGGYLWEYVLPRAIAQQNPAARPTVQELIAALDSDNSDQRESARFGLSRQNDIAAMRTMAGAWDVSKSSYRQDLGLLIAWTEGIKLDPGAAERLLETLAPVQAAHIVELTGHTDRTMRGNATQLTTLLLRARGAPERFLNAVLDVFRRSPQSAAFTYLTTAYNVLVALDIAECNLKPGARREVLTALNTFEKGAGPQLDSAQPRIAPLLTKVKDKIASCPV
jgi:hypothetical protein